MAEAAARDFYSLGISVSPPHEIYRLPKMAGNIKTIM